MGYSEGSAAKSIGVNAYEFFKKKDLKVII